MLYFVIAKTVFSKMSWNKWASLKWAFSLNTLSLYGFNSKLFDQSQQNNNNK